MSWIFVLGIFVIYMSVVFGALMTTRARRKTRWPFKDQEKLLRSPGEHLKRRIIEIDEAFLTEFVAGVAATAISYFVAVIIATPLKFTPGATVTLAVTCSILAAAYSATRTIRLFKERANLRLGWFGERLTAEFLDPLKAEGFRIFHDVPCAGARKHFNLDHVAVGPAGITVIETKTRRKWKSGNGLQEHEVAFDGQQLVWPWGKDGHGVSQAIAEAQWLEQYLQKQTGQRFAVKAVLALPGWYVKESPSSKVRVINPSYVAGVIRGRGAVTLTSDQIERAARELDHLCRDVED